MTGSTNTITESMKARYDELLVDYKNLLMLTMDEDDIVQGLTQLIELSSLVGQLDDTSDFTPCTRVIRLRTRIPMSYLKLHHYEPIIMDGYYLPVEGIMIPHHIMRQMIVKEGSPLCPYNVRNKLVDGYNYGTVHMLSDGRGFALKKGTPIENYVNLSCKYEYFDLKVMS